MKTLIETVKSIALARSMPKPKYSEGLRGYRLTTRSCGKLGALFLGLLLIPAFSFAQTTSATSSKEALIQSLYALLQTLENEIAAIIAQQAQMASTTQQIISTQRTQSQQIQQIAQNTTPLPGSTGEQSSEQSSQQSIPTPPSCLPNPQFNVATSTDSSGSETVDVTYTTGCPIPIQEPISASLNRENADGSITNIETIKGDDCNDGDSRSAFTCPSVKSTQDAYVVMRWQNFYSDATTTLFVSVGSDSETVQL